MAVAVITGANRGIGLGLAKRLAERGYDVVGTARSTSAADELRTIARVVALDVADPESCRALTEAVDGVALLVNNAATLGADGAASGPLASLDAQAIAEEIRTNTIGPVLVTQALTPKLLPGAKVVNISSKMGSVTETDSQLNFAYSVSKAALNMVTRQLAFDPALADSIVVSMCPGWVQTRMGGAGARLTVDESTAGIVSVIEKLQPSDSGSFWRYNGIQPPW